MNTFEIRPATEADLDFILRVNEENVEVLSPMDRNKLIEFMKISTLLWMAFVNGERAAFLIALDEKATTYDSENYRWFKQKYEHFLYIDRVVLDKSFRRIGLGKTLYENVFSFAKENNIPVVTAEIDTIPYNESSLNFHKAMGFKEVGTQFVRNGSIKVSLQSAEVRTLLTDNL